jgi:hypothetical protein
MIYLLLTCFLIEDATAHFHLLPIIKIQQHLPSCFKIHKIGVHFCTVTGELLPVERCFLRFLMTCFSLYPLSDGLMTCFSLYLLSDELMTCFSLYLLSDGLMTWFSLYLLSDGLMTCFSLYLLSDGLMTCFSLYLLSDGLITCFSLPPVRYADAYSSWSKL